MVCDRGPKAATPTDEAARNPGKKREDNMRMLPRNSWNPEYDSYQ